MNYQCSTSLRDVFFFLSCVTSVLKTSSTLCPQAWEEFVESTEYRPLNSVRSLKSHSALFKMACSLFVLERALDGVRTEVTGWTVITGRPLSSPPETEL